MFILLPLVNLLTVVSMYYNEIIQFMKLLKKCSTQSVNGVLVSQLSSTRQDVGFT
jgi:hypothetical protein